MEISVTMLDLNQSLQSIFDHYGGTCVLVFRYLDAGRAGLRPLRRGGEQRHRGGGGESLLRRPPSSFHGRTEKTKNSFVFDCHVTETDALEASGIPSCKSFKLSHSLQMEGIEFQFPAKPFLESLSSCEVLLFVNPI